MAAATTTPARGGTRQNAKGRNVWISVRRTMASTLRVPPRPEAALALPPAAAERSSLLQPLRDRLQFSVPIDARQGRGTFREQHCVAQQLIPMLQPHSRERGECASANDPGAGYGPIDQ